MSRVRFYGEDKLLVKQNRRAFLIMAAGVGTGVGLLAFLESQSSKGSPDERFESMLAPDGSLPHAQVALVYSRNYNISALGLERLHPFDSRKFGRIRDHLIEKGLRRSADFICPNELTREQLLTIHTPEYLESLKNRDVLSRILEIDLLAWVPEPLLEAQVLQPMRHASGGTLLACRLALKNKICINLGGGYHHADSDHGGGFCVYSDVPVAIKTLRAEGKIRKALIVDTDAHQGNGFATVCEGLAGAAFWTSLMRASIHGRKWQRMSLCHYRRGHQAPIISHNWRRSCLVHSSILSQIWLCTMLDRMSSHQIPFQVCN